MKYHKIFVECDLSQAEDRVVKCYTKAPKLIERARAMPWENDEHNRAAQVLFGRAFDEADKASKKDLRYIGKRSRHGGNYGMSGKKLSEEMLKDGHTYTPKECDGFINKIIDVDTPEVRDWQSRIRREIMMTRRLVSSWGRILDFSYERLGDDTYRRGYAFKPQGDVGDLLNQCGLIPLFYWLKQGRIREVAVNVQAHDALLVSTPVIYAYDVASFIRKNLEVERVYDGIALTIPVEVGIGRTWKKDHEWKRFPSRREFEDVAYGLASTSA